jgi:hypothetical protein
MRRTNISLKVLIRIFQYVRSTSISPLRDQGRRTMRLKKIDQTILCAIRMRTESSGTYSAHVDDTLGRIELSSALYSSRSFSCHAQLDTELLSTASMLCSPLLRFNSIDDVHGSSCHDLVCLSSSPPPALFRSLFVFVID